MTQQLDKPTIQDQAGHIYPYQAETVLIQCCYSMIFMLLVLFKLGCLSFSISAILLLHPICHVLFSCKQI